LIAAKEALAIKNVVVPGVEDKPNMGDFIGLFVQNKIRKTDFYEVVLEIKDQDDLVILPHPFKSHIELEKLIASVDASEALNGRSSKAKNVKALEFLGNMHKSIIAPSDAHFALEIGRVRTRFFGDSSRSFEDLKRLIIASNRELIGKESPSMVHYFSFATEIAKRVIGAN
jgi:predicted metal-dependent phosphoesterase TrpH